MSLESWNGASLSSALVDSALAGSQDEASLSWTSVSFWANMPLTPQMTIQATRTIHFVTGEVSFPAIWRCMGFTPSEGGDSGHRGFPREGCRGRPRQPH